MNMLQNHLQGSVNRKTVLVIYEYFYPGFKAGGPVQSLVNLISAFSTEYQFSVLTSAFDLGESVAYPDITLNAWNEITLLSQKKVNVWYAGKKNMSIAGMSGIITEVDPDIIFINGLFTKWSTYPLVLQRIGKLKNVKVIISARGMLQAGALQLKPLKKKSFLGAIKFAGLFRSVCWHATSEEEKGDIKRIMGPEAKVIVAANIPKPPIPSISLSNKKKGELRLIYLSLISEKKNLLLLLKALKKVTAEVSLSIYGPVKDHAYWRQCEEEMKVLPTNCYVEYRGLVVPGKVQDTLQQYHALISLTRGENFGHALYESLSAGRPLITSFYTPWNDLESAKAGWNVSIEDEQKIVVLLEKIAEMSSDSFNEYGEGAWKLAKQYYGESNFIESYGSLFA
jgi:glycosyltransferase involved in cell wall biosynthesis